MFEPHMELRHLRYFIGVAEEENVSVAALKLHVSQPALSRQVRDLEEELGFKLLERTAKSVRLTDAGRVFLAEARAVLQRGEDAVRAARAAAMGGGDLNVGYAPSLTARLLPQTLRAYQSQRPGARVKLHDLSTAEMVAQLRGKELQLAFLVRPTVSMLRGLHFEEFTRDPLCVALSLKHPLARRRSVALSEVGREPLIIYNRKSYPEYHQLLASLFPSTGRKPRVAEEHDSVSSLIASVEAGCGVAVVPASLGCIAGARLKLTALSPAPAPLSIGAAWLKNLNAAAESFLKCARQVAAAPGAPGS